jgi:hypothetical protein
LKKWWKGFSAPRTQTSPEKVVTPQAVSCQSYSGGRPAARTGVQCISDTKGSSRKRFFGRPPPPQDRSAVHFRLIGIAFYYQSVVTGGKCSNAHCWAPTSRLLHSATACRISGPSPARQLHHQQGWAHPCPAQTALICAAAAVPTALCCAPASRGRVAQVAEPWGVRVAFS